MPWPGIGIRASPVYYHEYMLGDLFAAQVRHGIMREVFPLKDVAETSSDGHSEVGVDLREKLFGPGNLHPRNEPLRRATGKPLNARYFAADLAE